MKFICKIILWMMGWSVDTNIPKESHRSVMLAAPHTTNWDGIFVRLALTAIGVPAKIAIKDAWTKFPISLLSKPMGFLGIDRSPKDPNKPRKSQIEQMADFFKTHEKIALVIAPEGTRVLRKEWKMGFYHVAKMANVPITFGYLDYKKKIAGVGGVRFLTDDIKADLKPVMDFYKTIAPKFPENFNLDERYA